MAIGAAVGGGSAALQHKDILKGALMGGVVGGVSGGIGGLGAGAAEVLPAIGEEGLTSGALGGVNGELGAASAAPVAPATNGIGQLISDPSKYLAANKYTLGAEALAGSIGPTTTQQPTTDKGTIYPYTYSQTRNPNYTGAGTPYFTQNYTAGTPYAAAEGGIMSLADGGNAVSNYNNILASRAQQEYVNSPQLGAFRSHFNDPIANADSTNALYQQYLGRAADSTGIAANQRATPEEITRSIQSSPEYLNRNPGFKPPTAAAIDPNAPPPTITYDPKTQRYISTPALVAPAGIAALPSQDTNSGGGGSGGAANGGLMGYADGGIYNLGSYSDGGRLLKGPGDGVSDDIPAQIGEHQPARLADGEFVVPARIVSELGNGSTDAGAKRLYAMMDRVQANRGRTIGKGKIAVNSKSDKYLPA